MAGCRQTVKLNGELVEIHICSLNEEKLIEETLMSVKEQCLIADNPDRVKIVLLDSGSTDKTVEIAQNYVDRILMCERGKLTARDAGFRNSDADIIVSFDADTVYPVGTAARLVKPMLDDPSVVVTTGYGVYENPLAQVLMGTVQAVQSMGRAVGLNYVSAFVSAIRRDAYLKSGGFNLGINQRDLWQMLWEEEFTIAPRLCNATGGKFKYVDKAVVYPSSRRIDPLGNSEFFEQIMSQERF